MPYICKLFVLGIVTWSLECSPMARETGVQSQVESYQRLKKWYLILPCLTISIIRYGSRIKWSNPENVLTQRPPLHLSVVAIERGAFRSRSTMVANFTFFLLAWSYNCLQRIIVSFLKSYNCKKGLLLIRNNYLKSYNCKKGLLLIRNNCLKSYNCKKDYY